MDSILFVSRRLTAFRFLKTLGILFVVAALGVPDPPAIAQPPAAQDPFALGVRQSEPLTPEQQQKTFSLPPGFTIQLVAAEPQIAKPMNLAFDVRGRLWVSSSEEYPFAAPPDRPAKDSIRVLQDTDGDGRMDSVSVFADGLNIPIGLYPYRDGVICFSIPNIVFLRDTDGDLKADTSEVLYGPFDTSRDTHGMCNAFRRGADGWIYACHGFNNRSEVTGRDGNKVIMHSGNTFRFRPDGSRIEHFTFGQVNPFGMAIDQFGDLFTADCHTKPVTLLLQGGNYDSFGRPHDGLGYVPNVMEHLHGSTAIAALALGQHTHFPEEWQNSSFDGNVMTSRINRNSLQHVGSSVRAVEEPDLCSSTDPWFRPVDLIPGPDGSLYVADFYNRIIGHYEVDLYHPGRDRFRGRIWKISYTGAAPAATDQRHDDARNRIITDFSGVPLPELVSLLATALPQSASLIADRIADEHADECADLLKTAATSESPAARARCTRLLQRLSLLDSHTLKLAAEDSSELVRVHAFRALNEMARSEDITSEKTASLLLAGFADESPMVRRVSVLAAARHLNAALIAPLMELLQSTTADDVHLRHAIRMTLRDHLLNEDWFRMAEAHADDEQIVDLAEICLALKSDVAGEFIAKNIETLADAVPQRLTEMLRFAASHVSPETAASVANTVQQRFSNDPSLQLQLADSMRSGFAQRGQSAPASVVAWAERIALSLMKMSSVDDLNALTVPASLLWHYVPHPETPNSDSCWVVSHVRSSSDGQQNVPLFSSIDKGEQRTGIWRSSAFQLNDQFTFFVAGHDGFPANPAQNRNFVRLVDAETGETLLQSPPPRNDVAHPVHWDTARWKGRNAIVELVDGDAGNAYAWLAVGRFSDSRLNPGDLDRRLVQAASLAGGFRLTSLRPALTTVISRTDLNREQKSAIAVSIVQLSPNTRLAAVAVVPAIVGASSELVRQALQAIVDQDETAAVTVLEAAVQAASSAEQLRLAELLCGDASGADVLAGLIEKGKASARLLLRPTVQQSLNAVAGTDLKRRIEQLTAGLPAEDSSIERRISDVRRNFRQQNGDAVAGKELFRKNCQICHQVAGEGKKVGPNLDGMASRGLDRVAEDVLAPNRNVDIAFRTTTVVTSEGKAFSGLLRELEGQRVSVVDSQGKETELAISEIDERLPSSLSPMPANLFEILNDQQLRDLLAYLLSLKQ